MTHRSAPPTKRAHARADAHLGKTRGGKKEQWGEQLGEARHGRAAALKDDSISMRTREVRSICISRWLMDCAARVRAAGLDSANLGDGGKMGRVGLRGGGIDGGGGGRG